MGLRSSSTNLDWKIAVGVGLSVAENSFSFDQGLGIGEYPADYPDKYLFWLSAWLTACSIRFHSQAEVWATPTEYHLFD